MPSVQGARQRRSRLVQIRDVFRPKLQDVETRHVEQLVDKSLKATDFVDELGMPFELGQDGHMGFEHGNRCTELMRGIGNEPSLSVEGRLQSVQTSVDGRHQRMHIAWKPAFGEPHGCGARANCGCLVCSHAQWCKTDACHDQIDEQEDNHEGDPDPGNVLDEFF